MLSAIATVSSVTAGVERFLNEMLAVEQDHVRAIRVRARRRESA